MGWDRLWPGLVVCKGKGCVLLEKSGCGDR